MRTLVFLALVAAGAASCAPAAAAASGGIDNGPLVRVVNVAPTKDTVEVQVGDEAPQRLVFGSATTFVRVNVRTAISVNRVTVMLHKSGAGCLDTLVVGGDDQPVELAECNPVRVASGAASVRFVNATNDSGDVMSNMSGGAAVPPFAAAPRIALDAGQLEVAVTSPVGERLGGREVRADIDNAYTAIWAGGGETPLRVLWIEDGRQPHDPPPVDVPIDTDAPGVASTRGATGATSVIGLVVLLLLGGAARRRVVPMAAALALLAACTQPGASDVSTATVAGRPPAPPITQPDNVRVADPAHLSMPSAAISAKVDAVDRRAGPELPHILSGADVAWFNGTSRPGEPGVALLAGHVVWAHGPGVFARLGDSEAGSTFDVTAKDGAVHSFTVVGKTVVDKARVDESLFAFTPERRVVLVTCAGPIDPARHLRTQNLVVLAMAANRPTVVAG